MRTAKASRGFTLAEVLVVVIILGVLASVALPRYARTVETSKADEAQAVVKMIGTTNRMYRLDNNALANGQLTGACAGAAPNPCSNGTGCALVFCRYLASQDWANKPYTYFAGQGTCPNTGGTIVACARRLAGAYPGTNNPQFTGWGYTMNDQGHVQDFGGAPRAQN